VERGALDLFNERLCSSAKSEPGLVNFLSREGTFFHLLSARRRLR
jgi:hypothetical protein